jgi:hypothetical protein
MPVYHCHGALDELIKEDQSRRTFESIQKLTDKATYCLYPNLGHQIGEEVLLGCFFFQILLFDTVFLKTPVSFRKYAMQIISFKI